MTHPFKTSFQIFLGSLCAGRDRWKTRRSSTAAQSGRLQSLRQAGHHGHHRPRVQPRGRRHERRPRRHEDVVGERAAAAVRADERPAAN